MKAKQANDKNKAKDASTKPSEPEKVDAYMAKLKHPLADVVAALRKIILSTEREIGEEIKWDAPAFFYSGEMKPSDPKEYKRYIIVFNLFQSVVSKFPASSLPRCSTCGRGCPTPGCLQEWCASGFRSSGARTGRCGPPDSGGLP
jgi:hypothetical protein